MSSRTRLGLSLAAALLLSTVASCNGGSDDNSAPPDESSAPGPTSAPETSGSTGGPTHTPTDTPSSSEFTQGPTENPNGSTAKRAKASQIPASEMPGLNDTWTWELASEGEGEGDSQPSRCMLSSLESIGAASTYRTDYNHPGVKTARATVITAVFPDEHTAVLSKTVLRSWHAQCEKRLKKELGYTRASVSKIRTDPTDVGPGEQWLSIFGPVPGHPDDGWFQGEGFVEDADTLTYIVIVSVGQDYNYDEGQQPMDLALVAAGAHLKSSRK
jgi:hypothetical protein